MWSEDQDEDRGATGRLNEHKIDNAGLKAVRENLVSQRSPAENSWYRRAHPAENS
jgi:hypothetical protein